MKPVIQVPDPHRRYTMARLLVILGFLLVVAAAAVAAEPTVAADPADMDGKTLFRTYCKTCHGPGAEAGEYSPLELIMDQWDEVFDGIDESHAEAVLESTDGKSVPEFLGGKLLDKIRKFCVDHAADSEEPMTCG